MNEELGGEQIEFNALALVQSGWRQGCFVPKLLVKALESNGYLPTMTGEGFWVVMTQDCDLLHKTLDNEPTVEVIFATKRMKKPNPSRTYGKDSRELHLPDRVLGFGLELHTKTRRVFPRQILMGNAPDCMALDEGHRDLLVRWIARKYRRAAFADAFNRRWYPIRSQWRKAVQESEGDLYAIYISVSSEELPAEQPYRIIVICVASERAMEDETIYRHTEALVDRFEELLAGCEGLEVVKIDLRSLGEVTLEDIAQLKRMDFDDYTLEGEGLETTPVDP